MVISSNVLFMTQTFIAIKDNLPHSRRNDVSRQDPVVVNYFVGIITVVNKVFGAVNDNPAVSALGYDCVLSILSFCVWYVLG